MIPSGKWLTGEAGERMSGSAATKGREGRKGKKNILILVWQTEKTALAD